MRQRYGTENPASIDGDTNVVTTTKSIGLIDRTSQREFLTTGKTSTHHHATGRLLDNVHIQVHLVGRTGYVNRINFRIGKVAKTSDTIFREANSIAVVP